MLITENKLPLYTIRPLDSIVTQGMYILGSGLTRNIERAKFRKQTILNIVKGNSSKNEFAQLNK